MDTDLTTLLDLKPKWSREIQELVKKREMAARRVTRVTKKGDQ